MYFVSILRPFNLIIIALTMLFIYFGVCTPSFAYANTCIRILVMCLLAGSGNVINDYFDQKVDTKNKPTSRIVGLLMKPQTAILYHAVLSLLALALALTLTIFNRDLFFVSSASVLIIALYFYTPLLKNSFCWKYFCCRLYCFYTCLDSMGCWGFKSAKFFFRCSLSIRFFCRMDDAN